MVRTVFVATSAAAALCSSVAFSQEPQGTASIPDFSGIWAHLTFPDVEPPLSGAGPVRNLSRVAIEVAPTLAPYNGAATAGASPNGVSNISELVGDFTNPILKPEAAEVVRQHGELSKKKASVSHARQPVLAWRRALRVLEHWYANAATETRSHDPLCK